MKRFESKVMRTVRKFGLIRSRDKVLVAASGGKDSTAVLHILRRHFDVEAITIDIGSGNYSEVNKQNVSEFCNARGIKLHTISFKEEFGMGLREILRRLREKESKLNPCAVCGVLRRYILNRKAREIGATKVATGHNLDDEAQSVMMNLLRYNLAPAARLGPITGSEDDSLFVPRIKPLYFCSEKEVEEYSKAMGFPVLYGRCPFSSTSYRNTIRNLLDQYELDHPDAKLNIVKSFQRMHPAIRKLASRAPAGSYCSSCGEPSQKEKCRACELIEKMVLS